MTFSDNLLLFQYAQNVNSESATKKQESKLNYIKAWVIGGFQSSANNIQTELNGLNMEYIILLWQSFMHFEVKNFFQTKFDLFSLDTSDVHNNTFNCFMVKSQNFCWENGAQFEGVI